MTLILIKLGGSVLTDKSIPFSFDKETTKRLSREIKVSEEDIVVVHGGGSFGHPGAERYGLNKRVPLSIKKGTAVVQRDMRRMNQKILEIMIDEDILAVSIPGAMITKYKDGKLIHLNEDIVIDYLNIGTVPVAFGDVAVDETRGVTICSGDDIMRGLAHLADMSIFVTNVDGIYKEGDVVDVFDKSMLPLTKEDMPDEGGSIDVTGSMERKAKLMLEVSNHCRTYVVNGKVPGRLSSLLSGKRTFCTRVKR